ncbi:MAG: hypothetical protein AAF485_14695 [Chloroflexota bacterium]
MLSEKKQRRKRFISGIFLTIISLCGTLLILEGATRFLPTPYPPESDPVFSCNHTLGWTGTPDFQGLAKGDAFEQSVELNALGMHDTEHPFEKEADTFRILMLGDSFVHAVQVPEVETSHQILEDQLNAFTETPVEVISHGVVHWGTGQQLTAYRTQGRHFQPDLVLLMVYLGNDLQDNLPGHVYSLQGRNCYAPYFTVCDGQLMPASLPYAPGLSDLSNGCESWQRSLITMMGTIYKRSRLYQQIEPLLISQYPRQIFGREYPSHFSALYFPTQEPELSQAWQVTLATLAQLQEEVEAQGGQFAIALISPDIVVQLATLPEAERAQFLQDNPIFSQAQLDLPNQQLATFLDEQQIPFIDLAEPLAYHLDTYKIPLYIFGDGHWNVDGNRIVGEALAQWLIDNEQLSVPRQ